LSSSFASPRSLRRLRGVLPILALGGLLSGCAADFRGGFSDRLPVDAKNCGNYAVTGQLDASEEKVADVRWTDDGTVTLTTSVDTYTGPAVKATKDGWILKGDLVSKRTGRKLHIEGDLRCK
jgi:hypothetical protein